MSSFLFFFFKKKKIVSSDDIETTKIIICFFDGLQFHLAQRKLTSHNVSVDVQVVSNVVFFVLSFKT